MTGIEDDEGSPLRSLDGDDEATTSPVSSNDTDEDERKRPSKKQNTTSSKAKGKPAKATAVRGSAGVALRTPAPAVKVAVKPAQRVLGLLPRKSWGTGDIKKPFKMPVPNFVADPNRLPPQLGMRKVYGLNLLASVTRFISKQAVSADTAPAGPAEPFLIYDPAQDTDEIKRSTLKSVYVEPIMAAKLRPHQKDGVTFMFRCLAGLEDKYTGAILMDGMGLGKTFQSICTLWTLLTTGTEGKPTCTRALIICPSSLVVNWGNELKKWIGENRVEPVVVDDTTKPKVLDALSKVWGGVKGLMGGPVYGKPQVLVLSYTTFRMYKDEVYKKKIDLVVCDEAHCLKNMESKITQAVSGIPAARRLLLSGTPVQNDLMEFYSLFHVAVPGLLGEKAMFKKHYETPILHGQDADATDSEQILSSSRQAELLSKCGTHMLRRTCGVMAKYLPPKVEQVVFCRMSALQIKLYEHFYNSQPVQRLLRGGRAAERAEYLAANAAAPKPPQPTQPTQAAGIDAMDIDASQMLTAVPMAGVEGCMDTQVGGGPKSGQRSGPKGGGKASGRAKTGAASGRVTAGAEAPRGPELTVLAAITAVKKLCCHPDLVYQIVNGGTKSSPYTQRTSGGGAAIVAPTADGAEAPKDVVTGFEGSQKVFCDVAKGGPYAPKAEPMHSGKIMVLLNLLKIIRTNEPTDKVVLVSNYTECLDLLQEMAKANRWEYVRLDGTLDTKKRQPLVDTFNDPQHPSFLMLLSSKAGGVGLNIIGANRLVLFDPDWNPANDLQAMARVWREGQKKHVWIYRMLTTGTLEEKIYQRQQMKQGLSKSVVDDGKDLKGQFSADELRSLFKLSTKSHCDTHQAIKCHCDGQHATMVTKSAQLAAKARMQTPKDDEDEDKVDEEAGIIDWAHLLDVDHSPDSVWKHVPIMCKKSVTFLFSDHITNPPKKPIRIIEEEEEEDEEREEEEAKVKGGCSDED